LISQSHKVQEEVVPGNHSTGYTNLKTSCSVLSLSFSNYSCGDQCGVWCKTCTQNCCQGFQRPAGQLSDFVLDLACTGDVTAVISFIRCMSPQIQTHLSLPILTQSFVSSRLCCLILSAAGYFVSAELTERIRVYLHLLAHCSLQILTKVTPLRCI
ncbi:hypothetical protein XENOCAPTIV_007395, partial [Xenoophorus captivus]